MFISKPMSTGLWGIILALGIFVAQDSSQSVSSEKPDENLDVKVLFQPIEERTSFVVGEPIFFAVSIQNTGKEPVMISVSNWMLDYSFTVTDLKGRPIPLTEYGQQAARQMWNIISRKTVTLTKGKSYRRDGFEISKIFAMSQSGRYLVSVRRRVRFPDLTWREITSSPVKITVR